MADARAALLRHAGLDDEAALLAASLPSAADTCRVAVRRALVALRFWEGLVVFAVSEGELRARLGAAGVGLSGLDLEPPPARRGGGR